MDVLSENHAIPLSLTKINDAESYYNELSPVLDRIDYMKREEKKIINGYGSDVLLYDELKKIFYSIIDVDDASSYLNSVFDILDKIKEYQDLEDKNLEKYLEDILKEDIIDIVNNLKTKFNSFWIIFKFSYYKAKKAFKKHLRVKSYIRYDTFLSDAQDIQRQLELHQIINTVAESIYKPLGNIWNFENTDLTNLHTFINKTLFIQPAILAIKSTQEKLYSPLETFWEFYESNTTIIRYMLKWLIKYQNKREREDDDQLLLDYILDSKSITT